MSKLTEFYNTLLDLCGVELGNHGHLMFRTSPNEDGDSLEIPLQYDGKPIVFPDKQYLNSPENKSGEVIILHPLSESSLRAPSEVQEVLRKAAMVRICEVGDFLLKRAIKINYDASMDKSIKLTPKLATLFEGAKEMDEKFITWFNKIDKAMQENSTYRLFNIFLRMHGEVGKNKFDRVGVISSPLYDELELVTDSTTIFGVEGGRKKDIAILKSVLLALFPELANGGYIAGSSSGTAPTLMAFMEVVALIAKNFNEVLIKYGKEAKGIERGTTKGVDFDRNINLTSLRSAHPIEDYNIGVGKEFAEKRDSSAARSSREETPVEIRKATPRDLEVPVRTSEPTRTTSEPETAQDLGNAFWMRDEREERYSRRDNDDRRRNERYDDRRESNYRRDDRDSNYRSSSYRRDDRDRNDYRRDSRQDDRRSSSYRRDDRNRESEYGQFWERG